MGKKRKLERREKKRRMRERSDAINARLESHKCAERKFLFMWP